MSYLTIGDITNLRLRLGSEKTSSDILKILIDEDIKSDFKSDMKDGVNYYDVEHEILNRDFREYFVGEKKYKDLNAANNKIVNAFHTLLVNQKNSYICGNPVVMNFRDESEKSKKKIEDIKTQLGGDDWDEFLCNWELNSSNKAVEYAHPFVDQDGNFSYLIINAEQIIPIYDTKFEKDLVELIRYYEISYIDSSGNEDKRYNAEWWTKENVSYYIQLEKDRFILDPEKDLNPGPHFDITNTGTGSKKGGSWGKVPFIPLLNNNNKKTDLILVKPLIDDFDLNTSMFSNNLEDIQEAVWKMSGYEGQELNEARHNLKTFKIVNLAEDGDLEPFQLTIPRDARDSHLDRLEENIFTFGMGVNPNKLGDGNITNIVIKSRYALLDLKANAKIRKFQKALQEFMYFVYKYNDEEYEKGLITFTFNKNLIINTQENILNCQMSAGQISRETILENHPFVDNVEKEKERLESDKQENLIDFDEGNDEN